ncbi:hypothetical protein [Rubrivirga sp.]|uniref:hypothetical protein n=1 Tax=Rubrivirga sp. TaxID=1885344 RepID=UPI003B51D496
MPTPGPLSPTKALESGPDSLPSAIVPDSDLAKLHLTADQVRQRLIARERDIQYHIDALKHEAMTVFDDVNIDGRPLPDRIREKPELFVAGAAGAGAFVGMLLGLWARAKRRPDPEDTVGFVRARLDVALEEAAHRVARGEDTEAALRRSMEPMPVAYGDTGAGAERERSSSRQAFDIALQTAVGFGVKAAMDVVVRRYTGHDGTIDALAD